MIAAIGFRRNGSDRVTKSVSDDISENFQARVVFAGCNSKNRL